MATERIRREITSSNISKRARRLAWLGPPPLFKGEDAAAYDELSARIAGAVKPADIFESFGSETSSTSPGRHSAYVAGRRV